MDAADRNSRALEAVDKGLTLENVVRDGERVFYEIKNGDRWILTSSTDDIVAVRHEPNAASGGQRRVYELGSFLMIERHSAQNQALRALISSLTRKQVAAPPIGERDTSPTDDDAL